MATLTSRATSLRSFANGRASAPRRRREFAAFGEALAYRQLALSGALEASASGLSGRNLKLTLDRTTLAGSLAFKSPEGSDPGRLDMDLSSDSLDVDTLPSLAAGKMIGDMDLSLSLRAGALHIARVGEAEINSGSVVLKASKSGPNVAVERLSIAGLGGASLDIQGAMDHGAVTATGRLRADRLRDFAVLVSRLAPGEWSRILVDRSSDLSPAALTFDAHGGAGGDGDDPGVDSLHANGSAGETQFTIALGPQPKDGGRALTASLDSSNSGALLRQLGLSAAPSGNGRAHVALNATGGWAQGYDVDATSSLAGADLSWRGRFLPAVGGDEAKAFGAVKLKAPNLAPLAVAVGLAPANGAALGPADIGFDATLRGDRWTFSKLAGSVAGVRASGNLTFQPATLAATPQAITTEIARAQEALGSAAGAVDSARSGRPSSKANSRSTASRSAACLRSRSGRLSRQGRERAGRMRNSPRSPLRPPSTSINLRVGTLDLTDALSAQGFATTLRFDKGRLDLDDFKMQIAEGGASGHATLRRDGETATLTGAMTVDSVAIERPGFSGRVGASFDFASTGRSPATLIDGLAGAGRVTFAGASLTRSDPAALDRVVAKAQTPDAPLDETNIAFAFGNELSRAPLPISDRVRANRAQRRGHEGWPNPDSGAERRRRPERGSRFRELSADTRLTLASSAADLKFWSGPPPSASVVVGDALQGRSGSSTSAPFPPGSPRRRSRARPTASPRWRPTFASGFFNRRLKGERLMDRRRQEIEDFEVERARLKGLAERLKAQEEAEKAAEIEEAAKKAAALAAEKAAAEKAAADNAEAAKSETRGWRGGQGAVCARRHGAEERRIGRQRAFACVAHASGAAEGARDPGRRGAGRLY